MKIEIEIDEKTLRELIQTHIALKLGDVMFRRDDIKIEVKSKQNYKSEWEEASFRARLSVST